MSSRVTLTGIRSGYFVLIRSASALRFSVEIMIERVRKREEGESEYEVLFEEC